MNHLQLKSFVITCLQFKNFVTLICKRFRFLFLLWFSIFVNSSFYFCRQKPIFIILLIYFLNAMLV